MSFGGDPPQKSKTEKENERLNNRLLKKQLADSGKQQEMPAYEAPPTPKYAPPPSQTNQDAEAAAREQMQKAKRRRGFNSSRIASAQTGNQAASGYLTSSGTSKRLGAG